MALLFCNDSAKAIEQVCSILATLLVEIIVAHEQIEQKNGCISTEIQYVINNLLMTNITLQFLPLCT